MQRSISPRLSLAVLAVVLAALVATPVSAQKRGGTLVLLVQPEPPNLAPHVSTSAPIGMITAKVYDGLLEYDFNLKPCCGFLDLSGSVAHELSAFSAEGGKRRRA